MTAILHGLYFLVDVLLGAWVWVLLLRFLLQKAGLSFHNPITQLLLRLTEWLIRPSRTKLRLRFWRGFDCAVLVWLIIFSCASTLLLSWLAIALFVPSALEMQAWNGLQFFSWGIYTGVVTLLSHVVQLFFFAVLIRALLSWFEAAQSSPIFTVLCQLTDPLLNLFRRYIPSLAGIDLSALWAMIALHLLQIVLFGPGSLLGSFGLSAL